MKRTIAILLAALLLLATSCTSTDNTDKKGEKDVPSGSAIEFWAEDSPEGNLKKEKGTIDESLTRTDAAKGSKMKVGETGKDAQKAITHYRVKQHYEGYDLVKIKLETGRMHQIRAHFASIGHPLLGDTRYGDFALNREAKKTLGLHRLFLHSCRLEFVWQGERKVFDCPLPKELQSVINQLKPIKMDR